VASELVLEEAASGDASAASKRTEALKEIELLELSQPALELAHSLVHGGPLPEKAAEDALHIAIAVVNGVEYLLTWNHKHLANAAMRASIEKICRQSGYEPAILCTPEELLEE
jgi:hypothetical protein